MTTLPTISEIKANILADLQSEFDITTNPFGQAFLTGLATVLAGIFWLIYVAIGMLQANIWVDTCDADVLIRYGVIILGRYPFAAGAAQYNVTVTGSIGAIIPGSMVWKSDDTSKSPGALFQIDGGDYALTGTTDTIQINALAGGLGSLLNIGDTLTATAPMINVNAAATVTVEITAPTAAETIEEYRGKVIEKIQLVPGGWSAIDYRLVGLEITGVGQTYAYATSGQSAEVDVYLQGTVAGVPVTGPYTTPGTVLYNYAQALELVRPLGVFLVHYYASAINNIDITITMGSFPAFSSAQQTLIQTALTDFVNSVHPFIAACDDVSLRNDVIATYNLSTVISQAVPGSGFSSVTFDVGGIPSTNWLADLGQIPFLNSITYV